MAFPGVSPAFDGPSIALPGVVSATLEGVTIAFPGVIPTLEGVTKALPGVSPVDEGVVPAEDCPVNQVFPGVTTPAEEGVATPAEKGVTTPAEEPIGFTGADFLRLSSTEPGLARASSVKTMIATCL
ncbi:MAG: hypothetical protein HY319_31160 [Armatimonadetes bacterium]|nr:hypothetical protein [Armatimonadota bacterium]